MNDDTLGGDRPIPPPKTAAPLEPSPLATEPGPMDAVERDTVTPALFGHPFPEGLAPDIRDRPPGEYHGQPYGGRTTAPRSWWDKTRDRLGAMLGDEEARQRLRGEPSVAPGTYDSRRDDTGWSDPVHPDSGPRNDRP